jgi:hypothetical protein
MNQHPIVLLYPLFRWLNYAVAEYGLYLYMATVWLSPLLIAWILNGGFWRRPAQPRRLLMPPPLPKLPVAMPPPLPESESPPEDDSQSFAA